MLPINYPREGRNVEEENYRRTATKWTTILALCAMLALSFAIVVNANPDPQAPSVMTSSAGRRENFPTSQTAPAYAGNVTQIDITNEQLTKGWQGYYGSVSGTIVLDDALNNSMFTWALSAVGEVYAAWNATTPDWSNLVCMDDSTAATEASRLNILDSYADNLTNTFSITTHPGFNVSTLGFEPNVCNLSVQTYVNDTAPDGSTYPRVFNETALWDPTNSFSVYMALLNDDQYGFNGSLWDFQMLVPEDGWDDNTDETTYYFYVELQ